jgi:hypothetical protein
MSFGERAVASPDPFFAFNPSGRFSQNLPFKRLYCGSCDGLLPAEAV